MRIISLEKMLEKDRKTLKTFQITYPVIKNDKQEIISQIGLFKSLDPVIQHELKTDDTKIKIIYNKANPIDMLFVIDDRYLKKPVMISEIKK